MYGTRSAHRPRGAVMLASHGLRLMATIGAAPKRARAAMAEAPPWFESLYAGAMSDEYKAYMRAEWGAEKRGDVPLFEKLSLEGAQAGLSWATILAKREAYRRAFHSFDVKRCAAMTYDDVDALLSTSSTGRDAIVRHRGKCLSVVNNAKAILRLAEEQADAPCPEHGYFDALIWSFVSGVPQLSAWADPASIPAETATSRAMSDALKARGFSYVGPKICYSLMQSCGLVVDHPVGTPEWRAAKKRIEARAAGGPAGPTGGREASRSAGSGKRHSGGASGTVVRRAGGRKKQRGASGNVS